MEATDSAGRVVNEGGSTPPPATLTVAAVARRLGVAPPTLRTWDRRYGLGPSAHTAGAHRRYSPADVARLMVMRRLTLEGVSPADAAKIALASEVSPDGRTSPVAGMHTPADGYDLTAVPVPLHGDGFGPDPEGFGPEVSSVGSPAADDDPADRDLDGLDDVDVGAASDGQGSGAPGAPRLEPPAAGDDDGFDGDETDWTGILRSLPSTRGAPGGGRVVAMPDGTPQSRGLARAAMSLDTYETHRILRDTIRREGVVETWNSMIVPVLRALGERVRVTGDGIDVEHAFSEVILGVMRGVALSVESPGNSPIVLLACADSDYHSLPLHALAAALAERDVPTRMLGSGLPPHALSASVRRTGPSVIVLFARMPGADAGDTEALRRRRPAPTVVLAGPGWVPESIPATARTAATLADAVDEVLRAVHA